MPDEDTPWYLQLLVSMAVLVGVAALIGGVLAVGGLAATRLLDFPSASSSSASVSTPTASSSSTPTTLAPTFPKQTTSPHSPKQTTSPHSPRTKPPRTTHSPELSITLMASPPQVSAYQRIDLTGTYLAATGTTLQVQRKESNGDWLDFPTTASVDGGRFTTYIETGRTGTNFLRMADSATGKVSNVVTVQVG